MSSLAPSRWQFSLKQLLIGVVAVSLWCTIASWSLAWANVLGLVGLNITWLVVRQQQRPLSMVAFILALCPAGYVLYHMPLWLRDNTSYDQTVMLEIVVKDAQTNQPIGNAEVEWWTQGQSLDDITSPDGSARIEATLPARRQNLGWGRSLFKVDLSELSVFISVADYEATHVNWAAKSGTRFWVTKNGGPLRLEILLTPVQSILDTL